MNELVLGSAALTIIVFGIISFFIVVAPLAIWGHVSRINKSATEIAQAMKHIDGMMANIDSNLADLGNSLDETQRAPD